MTVCRHCRTEGVEATPHCKLNNDTFVHVACASEIGVAFLNRHDEMVEASVRLRQVQNRGVAG